MCIVSNAILQVLTRAQKPFSVPDRGLDHQEAQFHDDKTLLEEMRTKIKATLSKDPKE